MLRKSLVAMLFIIPSCGWCMQSSLYLGAGIGADSIDFTQTSYVKKPKDFNVINKAELAAQGIFGTVYGGYGWTSNILYLAAELNGDFSSAQYNASNIETIHGTVSQTTYEMSHSFGASLLPGLVCPADILLYARVGYTGGFLRINTTDASLANTNTMLSGVRYGLGIQKDLYRGLGLRFEFTHSDYQSNTGFTLDPLSKVTKQTIVSPDNNQFELSANYRFAGA